MAEDWAVDVKKYVPNADQKATAGIVRYFGNCSAEEKFVIGRFLRQGEVACCS